MSTALMKSLDSSRAFARASYDGAMQLKAAGMLSSVMTPTIGGGPAFLSGYKEQAQSRENYATFRNWLYSAVNMLAMEASGQPIVMARLAGAEEPKDESKRRRLNLVKRYQINKMPRTMRTKAAAQEYEMILDHPVLKSLEQPNTVQRRWQFVYSFVANLNLTGWAYVLFDTDKDGVFQFYSVPTTWVRPDHKDGPYTKFYVVKPGEPLGATDKPLTRDNVAFAYLPDPSNPLGAIAPATSQMPAIRIDDYIQQSQEQHFQNGIFPSVIVTIGKDPHPDVPGGIRPRLSGAQRRQVFAAIGKAMGGVANYGSPAIVDGMIESITRFSATENEMGWGKSEDKVRTRILSAFAVHPYILGEPVGVGGYAQVANIEKRFYKRVNSYLDMLSGMLTDIVRGVSGDEGLLVWLEECQVVDPSLKQAALQAGRANGDISQNEWRAEQGLPPDEDRNEAVITGNAVAQIVAALGLSGQGAVSAEQMRGLLTGMGLPDDLVVQIAGEDKPPPMQGPSPFDPQAGPPKPEGGPPKPEEDEALAELRHALVALKEPLKFGLGEVFDVKFNENHDEQGRFAEGGGSSGAAGEGSSGRAATTADRATTTAEGASKRAAAVRDNPKSTPRERASAHREAQRAHKEAQKEHEALVDRALIEAAHRGEVSVSDPKVVESLQHQQAAATHRRAALEHRGIAVHWESVAKN